MISDCATRGLDQEVKGPKAVKCDSEPAEEVGPRGLSPLVAHERTTFEGLSMEVTNYFANDPNGEYQRGAYITGQMKSRSISKCRLRDLVKFFS